jgi:hypothetical protein
MGEDERVFGEADRVASLACMLELQVGRVNWFLFSATRAFLCRTIHLMCRDRVNMPNEQKEFGSLKFWEHIVSNR